MCTLTGPAASTDKHLSTLAVKQQHHQHARLPIRTALAPERWQWCGPSSLSTCTDSLSPEQINTND